MYPYDIFAGIDLYTVFLGLGVVAAILMIRICGDRMRLEARTPIITTFSRITRPIDIPFVNVQYLSFLVLQVPCICYNVKPMSNLISNRG